MSNKISVGLLGATGAVGQKFVKLLKDHPWFELTEIAASDRSTGRRYKDATIWRQYFFAAFLPLGRISFLSPQNERRDQEYLFICLQNIRFNLFRAQRDYWIHLCCFAGGDITRHQSHASKQH
jgi:N-acetyl-gamma-glutamylphosphate reductase